MKRLTLIFNHFEVEHLGKDVFLLPYYLKRKGGYKTEIVYPRTETNKNFPSVLRGVHLFPLNMRGKEGDFFICRELNFLCYLLRNASRIDVFLRFHYTLMTALMILMYKFLNRKGKAYVKLDGYMDALFYVNPHSFREKVKKYFLLKSLDKVDLITCETSIYYKKMMKEIPSPDRFKEKVMIVRNGFDEEMLSTLNLKENIYQKKENAILTVGRLGTYVKNTEMLLRALKQIDLKDWKFYFVGPIETDFKPCISDFFNRYPEKRSSVIFVGAIYDKRELWEYYNRAKVFVLPSRSECYALVLNEALRFRNYLILTDVGAASDVIQEGKYGSLIEQDDDKMLAQRIQDIIDGKIDIDVFSDFDPQMISWDRIIDDFFTNSSL